MLKKSLILAIMLMAGAMLTVSVSAQSASGTNNVNVTSCERVSGGIKISRNGGVKYILSNGCRDTGFGARNYVMTCVSATQYKVSWTASCGNIDVVAPVVNIASVKVPGIEGQAVKVTASATDNIGVTKIEIYSNDVVYRVCTNVNSCNVILEPYFSAGTVARFYAKAYDAAGNVGVSATIDPGQFDTVKPTVNITSERSDYSAGDVIHFKAGASDNVGVTKMEYVNDSGKILKTCLNVNACNYNAGPFTGSLCVLTFTVRASDAAGNIGYGERIINIGPGANNVAPKVSLTGSINVSGAYSVQVIVTDAKSKIKKIEVYWGDGKLPKHTWTETGVGNFSVTREFSSTLPTSVTNRLIAKAYDAAGNVDWSAPIYLTAPNADSIPSVSANVMIASQSGVSFLTLSGQASDDVGLASVELYWGASVDSLSLVKRCDYNSVIKSDNCALSVPLMFAKSGYYKAKATDTQASTFTTAVKNYSFPL